MEAAGRGCGRNVVPELLLAEFLPEWADRRPARPPGAHAGSKAHSPGIPSPGPGSAGSPAPGARWASQVFARRDLAPRSRGEVRLIGVSHPLQDLPGARCPVGGHDVARPVGQVCPAAHECGKQPPGRCTCFSVGSAGGWVLPSCPPAHRVGAGLLRLPRARRGGWRPPGSEGGHQQAPSSGQAQGRRGHRWVTHLQVPEAFPALPRALPPQEEVLLYSEVSGVPRGD